MIAKSPTDYRIRVTDCGETFDTKVPASGQVTFDVPVASRHCTQYFLGIRIHSAKPVEKRKVIQIVNGDKVVRKLSAQKIGKLPTDSDGYRIVEVEN